MVRGLSGLRLMAEMKAAMGREGGSEWTDPLAWGIDPLFDRVDFRETPEGKVAYIGDCTQGGWRR